MDKTRYSAFCGTDLNQKLRERGITEVDLVGYAPTSACCIPPWMRIITDTDNGL
ncbi:Uncharacterised protein [Actinobacillus pleuropneumoniae]|nr:Uncharacterised protein [Actinobacillus pleuropneumoniae]